MFLYNFYKLKLIFISTFFLLVIFLPFIVGIWEEDKNISVVEKRFLAPFPSFNFNVNGIGKFITTFDKYYSDHFGFREFFVEKYKSLKYGLGDSPSIDVTLGKDGWLFLGSVKKGYNRYSDPIGDARNINLFSEDGLNQLSKEIQNFHFYLKCMGVKYIFVIAPNKHTVYFNKLPEYIKKVNEYSAADQLVQYLESNTDIHIVDLRKKMIEKKDDSQLYFKTDSHWNHFGANLAQYEIMMKVQELFPGLMQPELFQLQEDVGGVWGDLAGFVGACGLDDINPQPIFKNSCEPVKQPANALPNEPHSYSCEGAELTALIYRDSFFTALQPYFARKFRRSTYIWEKMTYSSLVKYIQANNIDIVIEEWVERDLPYVPNRSQELERACNRCKFLKSKKGIFLNDFRSLSFNRHVKKLKDTGENLLLESIGNDPILYFPSLPLEKGQTYIVHIVLESSVSSILQLFYSGSRQSGYPFSERRSLRVEVHPGRNDVYLGLDYEYLGDLLRLDPIVGPGAVVIETIEIREINKQYPK
ncbi:MAG: hypothetical protein CSA33_06945 [Desulfobulbus propionicus]|nr:MAG: hypothetical protein CSA33_06945 [Desulfobulbus propionicus]